MLFTLRTCLSRDDPRASTAHITTTNRIQIHFHVQQHLTYIHQQASSPKHGSGDCQSGLHQRLTPRRCRRARDTTRRRRVIRKSLGEGDEYLHEPRHEGSYGPNAPVEIWHRCCDWVNAAQLTSNSCRHAKFSSSRTLHHPPSGPLL